MNAVNSDGEFKGQVKSSIKFFEDDIKEIKDTVKAIQTQVQDIAVSIELIDERSSDNKRRLDNMWKNVALTVAIVVGIVEVTVYLLGKIPGIH